MFLHLKGPGRGHTATGHLQEACLLSLDMYDILHKLATPKAECDSAANG